MRAVPIIRSRTGCFTCRRRKKKCSEEKPICIGCKRNKLGCTWPADMLAQDQSKWSDDRAKASSSSSSRSTAPTNATTTSAPPLHPSTRQLDAHSPVSPRLQQSQTVTSPLGGTFPDASSFRSAESPDLRRCSTASSDESFGHGHEIHDEVQSDLENPASPATPSPSFGTFANLTLESNSNSQHSPGGPTNVSEVVFVSGREGLGGENIYLHENIPMDLSLLPSHGHDSFELLSYYLSRTANSMGNGSTDINPFVAKLIPLAFSDPLVLHLILAQSAVHRYASRECTSGGEVATRYYSDSLRMFRNLIGEYVAGKEDKSLVVTVGSLILCLTEVARGDVDGTIFDHLAASKSLLTSLLSGHGPNVSGDLPEFLVEYYMHMVASSMISKDPRGTAQAAPSPAIEDAGKQLLAKNYMGQLCGCWLEILTLIPQVFQLGQSILQTGDQPGLSTSPDDIIAFGLLQSKILEFIPSVMASPSSRLAGLVFKQAALLYLWSIFGTPQQNAQTSMHGDLMNSAVMEAVSFLNRLPASERVNTSLCWPLMVIGCCTTNPDVQHTLRLRLQAMIEMIGLGNMHQTLTLLQHVWEQPPENISPWTLRSVMQKYEIWISFA